MRVGAGILDGVVLSVAVLGVAGEAGGALDPSVSCADLNGDDALNVGDPVLLSRYLFLGVRPGLRRSDGFVRRP